MSVLHLIIRHEVLENLMTGRCILTVMLCMALSITSITVMSHDYTQRQKRFEHRDNARGVRELPDDRLILAKRPRRLSVVAEGLDEIAGRPLIIGDWQPAEEPIAQTFHYYGEERHLLDLFDHPDLVYVINAVLSVLAVFWSFDTICGNKETHTLSLLLSNPLPRSRLLVAKWIGGYMSLSMAVLPGLLLVVALTASTVAGLRASDWQRLLCIIVVSLVYLSIPYTLGLLISVLTHRSGTALALALAVWVVWAFGVPRAGILAAQATNSTLPMFVFRMTKDQVGQGAIADRQEELWQMDDAYLAKIDAQTRVGQTLSRLSPSASYVYASTTLAGTGLSDYRHFRQQVSLWDRMRRRGSPSSFGERTYPFGESLSLAALDLLLLVVWDVLLFVWATRRFLNYDVR